jgi:7-carboxy-7-deazaguanine synthase (Cx14CxxC type)
LSIRRGRARTAAVLPHERSVAESMSYSVKEIFFTLQGEGANSGRAAVFCRFAGCNLWSGREPDRSSAICRFCDTDFVGTGGVGGGSFADAGTLAARVRAVWGDRGGGHRLVVLTGGEPLLQAGPELVAALHEQGFSVALETNGTIAAPDGIDWICVSPKAGSEIVQRRGDELKLVYPQQGISPELCEHWKFHHFFLQPMDGPRRRENTEAAARYCMQRPQWRLSLQTHKIAGFP